MVTDQSAKTMKLFHLNNIIVLLYLLCVVSPLNEKSELNCIVYLQLAVALAQLLDTKTRYYK